MSHSHYPNNVVFDPVKEAVRGDDYLAVVNIWEFRMPDGPEASKGPSLPFAEKKPPQTVCLGGYRQWLVEIEHASVV